MDLARILHPSVLKKVREFSDGLYVPQAVLKKAFESSDQNPTQKGQSEERIVALSQHGKVWFKVYGREFLWKGGSAWSACLGTMLWAGMAHNAIAIGLCAATTLFTVGGTVKWVLDNRKKMSPEELRCLLPAIALEDAERAYCEAVLGILSSKSLDKDNCASLLEELNNLVGGYSTLDVYRREIISGLGGDPGKADAELALLQAQLEDTSDPKTKSTITQSMEILRQRMSRHDNLKPLLGQVSAQQELIRQALRSIQESVARLAIAPERALTLDLENLRRTVGEVNSQATAVEQAVDELLQIRVN
jgi:hypothetical protein